MLQISYKYFQVVRTLNWIVVYCNIFVFQTLIILDLWDLLNVVYGPQVYEVETNYKNKEIQNII